MLKYPDYWPKKMKFREDLEQNSYSGPKVTKDTDRISRQGPKVVTKKVTAGKALLPAHEKGAKHAIISNSNVLHRADIKAFSMEEIQEISYFTISIRNPAIIYSRNQKLFLASNGKRAVKFEVEDGTMVTGLKMLSFALRSSVISDSCKVVNVISDDRMQKCFFEDSTIDYEYREMLYEITEFLRDKKLKLRFYYVPHAFLSISKYCTKHMTN